MFKQLIQRKAIACSAFILVLCFADTPFASDSGSQLGQEGVVPFRFSLELESVHRTDLNEAMRLWVDLACVRFEEHGEDDEGYPLISISSLYKSSDDFVDQVRKLVIPDSAFGHQARLLYQLLPLLNPEMDGKLTEKGELCQEDVDQVRLHYACKIQKVLPVTQKVATKYQSVKSERSRRQVFQPDYGRPMVQFITAESFHNKSKRALFCSLNRCELRQCTDCLSDKFKFFITESPTFGVSNSSYFDGGFKDFTSSNIIPEPKASEKRYLDCSNLGACRT